MYIMGKYNLVWKYENKTLKIIVFFFFLQFLLYVILFFKISENNLTILNDYINCSQTIFLVNFWDFITIQFSMFIMNIKRAIVF